jgi:glycosyltransferase involved in cell wall biosynthesis
MRIAHFIHRYPPALGGAEAYFGRLSRALVAAGHSVTVFTTTALDLPALWSPAGRSLPPGRSMEDGVEVLRFAPWRLPGQRYLLKLLSLWPGRTWQAWTRTCNPLSWAMWQAAGRPERAFDLVHASAFPFGSIILCARRLAQRLKLPLVLTPFFHLGNLDDPADRVRRSYFHPCLLSLARSAQRILVQTEGERQALRGHGFPEEQLVLQGMGLAPEELAPGDRAAQRAAWDLGPDEVVVGHLANLSWEKGSIDLLQAAERAWDRGGRFRLNLAGPEMPGFQRFWRTYRSADRVRRLGVLPEEGKRDFFAGLDLLALPSRVDSFGLVILEAWAQGVPSIAYRAGGVPWVIRHEQDGLLAPCGDVEALTGGLLRLVADGSLRRRLGQAGQEHLQGELTWERCFRCVLQVYENLHAPGD